MNKKPLDQLIKVITDALNGAAKVRKNFRNLIIETIILYMGIPKRINFIQLARYGKSCESRFRQNFSRKFDWVGFNSYFTKRMKDHRTAIAIDPSFITKSGKHTPGIGYFWSGCANAVKRGLEILGIALIDADAKDAVQIKAVQTVDIKKVGRPPKYLEGMDEPNSLIAWYLRALADEREALQKLSNVVVADAFFSKATFVNGLQCLGFELVSRFRSDVSLKYLYTGQPTGRKGRPKKFDGQVDLKELREDVFKEEVYDNPDGGTSMLRSAVVWATSLKRKVRVVIVDCPGEDKKTQTRKIFFSTDVNMLPKDIMDIYKTRFQIEFLLRDAKQFTGLCHCQSRKKEKLDFAFNCSLASINVAREFARRFGNGLSVAGVKTLIHNAMILERFLMMSGHRPNKHLNTNDFKELLYYGVADAA